MSTSLFGQGQAITVDVSTTVVSEDFTATAGQNTFVLTNFSYALNTGSLMVFINGTKQIFTKDFIEISSNSFKIIGGVQLGDYVEVIGFPQVIFNDSATLLRSQFAATTGGTLVGVEDNNSGTLFRTLAQFVAKMAIWFSIAGYKDGTGAIRKAFSIGPGTNPAGLICMDATIAGDYQPSPPSGPYGFHAIEDKTSINMTGYTNAYASYSFTPTIVGSSNYDHFKCVQAWPSYTSSGNMNDMDIIDTYPNHSGAGTITNLRHYRVRGNLGTGVIQNEFGLHIDGVNRGTVSNYAIYSISAAHSFHYGAMGIGPGTSGVATGLLVGGGQIRTLNTNGYFEASSSQSRFGPADQFIGSAGATDTGVSTYNDLHLAVGATSMVKLVAAGHWMPSSDNVKTLGAAGNRWSTVYAGTGAINTSDARAKQQIKELSDREKAVGIKLKQLIKSFKFNDAVILKGDAARIHVGWIAQDVKAAFEAEDLSAEAYAVLCYDEWDDVYVPVYETQETMDPSGAVITAQVKVGERLETPAGNRYGVRETQIIAFILAASV